MNFFNTKFLDEPAYRWMAFAVAASLFLYAWGRVINLMGDVIE